MHIHPLAHPHVVQKILLANQGKITEDELVTLARQVVDSQDFNITDEIRSSLSFLLKRIFSESDTDSIADKLCKLEISCDTKKMIISISFNPKQVRDVLIATGVLKVIEDNTKRKKISF